MNKIATKIEAFIKQALLDSKDISEIIIQNNKPIVSISHDNRFEILKNNNPFKIDDVLDFSLNQNQVISHMNPSIGGIIDEGLRWHLVMAPITVDLFCLQFRKIDFNRFDIFSLLNRNTRKFLEDSLVSKQGCIFFGETFSGKSTLLNSMITHFHSLNRVIILERYAEISPANPFWTNLNCHQNSLSIENEFNYDYLLKQTQRLRPDVLVIGEITSFGNDIFRRIIHSGFQKVYLTVHGTDSVT